MQRAQVEHRPAVRDLPAVELRRSTRRRRSADANLEDGRVVVRLPAGLSAEQEAALIGRLVRRVTGADRARAQGGDEALAVRAHELADRYLDGVRAEVVTWSTRMRRRHGSCTPATRTVRVSARLAAAPGYVVDYVLVHELAHLQHPDHSEAFWALVGRFPAAERARGYLEGFAAGQLEATSRRAAEPAADPGGG